MTNQIEWTNNPKQVNNGPRGKYPAMLAEIKAQQPLHPGQWALLVEFRTPNSAKDTAYRLRGNHPGFQFRSGKNPETGTGMVYARYTGVTT